MLSSRPQVTVAISTRSEDRQATGGALLPCRNKMEGCVTSFIIHHPYFPLFTVLPSRVAYPWPHATSLSQIPRLCRHSVCQDGHPDLTHATATTWKQIPMYSGLGFYNKLITLYQHGLGVSFPHASNIVMDWTHAPLQQSAYPKKIHINKLPFE